MPDVEHVDDLYGVDPAQFVAVRDALARRLRAAGDRATAAEVKALRRPPKSAWALNALARSEPALIEAVISTAAALAEAFDRGGDLRAAQSAYRDAIHEAVTTAADRAGIEGESLRTRMRDTLFAAGADTDVADALTAGTLRDDHEAPGFGIGTGTGVGAAADGRRQATARSTHPSARDDVEPDDRRGSAATPKRSPRRSAAARLAAPARGGSPSSGAGQATTGPSADVAAATDDAAATDVVAAVEVAEGADNAEPAADRTPRRSELERRADLRRQRELDRDADRLRRKADRLRRDAEDAEARAAETRREAEAAEQAATAKEREADSFRDEHR